LGGNTREKNLKGGENRTKSMLNKVLLGGEQKKKKKGTIKSKSEYAEFRQV